MVGTQFTLITTVAITFVVTLFGLIVMISVLRRTRETREQRELAILAASLEFTQPTQVIREDTQRVIPIVIDEPAPVYVPPTNNRSYNLARDQRNIRKLMEFLNKEAVQNHLVQEPAQNIG